MKTAFLLCQLFGVLFLMSPSSCQPEYIDNSRIFVEGKVVSPSGPNSKIQLNSEDILISETKVDAAGNFKLGGPGTTGNKILSFERKITSFSSNEPDCRLDYDSLNIILPANKNYFNFTQIIFKP